MGALLKGRRNQGTAKYSMPKVDWTRRWTGKQILKEFGYTDEEIEDIYREFGYTDEEIAAKSAEIESRLDSTEV